MLFLVADGPQKQKLHLFFFKEDKRHETGAHLNSIHSNSSWWFYFVSEKRLTLYVRTTTLQLVSHLLPRNSQHT